MDDSWISMVVKYNNNTDETMLKIYTEQNVNGEMCRVCIQNNEIIWSTPIKNIKH